MVDKPDNWDECLEYFHNIATEDALFGEQEKLRDRLWFVVYAALVSILPLLIAFYCASEFSAHNDSKRLGVETSATIADVKNALQSIKDKNVLSQIEKAFGRSDFSVFNEYSRSLYILIGIIMVFFFFVSAFSLASYGIYTRSLEKQIAVDMNGRSRKSAVEYSRQAAGTFLLIFFVSVVVFIALNKSNLKSFDFAIFDMLEFLPGKPEEFDNGLLLLGFFLVILLTTICTFFSALTTNFYARRYPKIQKHSTKLHTLHVMRYYKESLENNQQDSVWKELRKRLTGIEETAVVDPNTTALSLKHAITKICFPLFVLYGFVLIVFWFTINYLVRKYSFNLDGSLLYIENWEQILMASADGWLFIIATGLTVSLYFVYLKPLIRLNPYLEAEENKAKEKQNELQTAFQVEFKPSVDDQRFEVIVHSGKIKSRARPMKAKKKKEKYKEKDKQLSKVIGADRNRLGILLGAVNYGGGFHEVVHGAFQGSASNWIVKLKPWFGTLSPTLLVGFLSLFNS